jgi:ubiquinone/menaquinone biosynthesis C-methylase UbiE
MPVSAPVAASRTDAGAAPAHAAVPPLDPARGRAQLQARLRRLGAVFDLPAIRAEAIGIEGVRTYYEDCHDAFRKYHSAEGAVHMALNEEPRFDAAGFASQMQRIEARWRLRGAEPRRVLELGFGQGFNLEYLSRNHAALELHGVDLAPTHLALARSRLAARGLLGRVQLELGDFHALPQAAASIDEVFAVEAMCHARELPRALAEVARVLEPGGALTLFDGYLPRAPSMLDETEALAVELLARGMAVNGLQVVDEVVATAATAGLVLESQTALDRQVLPTLARLERTTDAVIWWPWLGRRALARRSPARGRNVMAGVLMRTAVSLGLVSYRQFVFTKGAPR